jgi:hypothetical protein
VEVKSQSWHGHPVYVCAEATCLLFFLLHFFQVTLDFVKSLLQIRPSEGRGILTCGLQNILTPPECVLKLFLTANFIAISCGPMVAIRQHS